MNTYKRKDASLVGIILVLFFLIALAIVLATLQHRQVMRQYAATTNPPLAVNYANAKYTLPSYSMTGCTNPSQWSYFTATCYTTIQHNCSNYPNNLCPVTAKNLITQDFTYMKNNGLGAFTRLFVSTDQLFDNTKWSNTTGFGGYDSQALANLDDTLHTTAALNMKIGLVLYLWESGEATGFGNMFHPEALDGNHSQMRANYLSALQQLITHIQADPQDTSAIAYVDLQNEGYYQNEIFFHAGTTDTSTIGNFNFLEPAYDSSPTSAYQQCLTPGNNQCTGGSDQHGCRTSTGYVDTTCVDINMSYPFYRDMYNTVKTIAPNMLVTVSDAGGALLTTNPTGNPFLSQTYLLAKYNFGGKYVDLFDEHLYEDDPSSSAQLAKYQSAANLPSPWIAGEAGCHTVSCTYDGTNHTTLTIDSWWLDNLKMYGAQAVLIEQYSSTAVTYPNGYGSQVLSPVGQKIASLNTSVISPTPTSTLTPTTTPTIGPSITPTPIPLTATPTPVATKLTLTIGLDGIGKAGDNVSRTSTGNLTPLHPTRTVTLTLFDQNNNPLSPFTGQITYDTVSGLFKGTVILPNTLTSGVYTLKVSTPSFLLKAIPGILTLTNGQTTIVPAFDLVAGDINNDNQISLLDYNQLLTCFGSSSITCSPSDLDDDGTVGGSDYNLFLRELSVQIGG